MSTASSVFVARLQTPPSAPSSLLNLFTAIGYTSTSACCSPQTCSHCAPALLLSLVSSNLEAERNAWSQLGWRWMAAPRRPSLCPVSFSPKTCFLADAEMITCHTSGFDHSNPSHETRALQPFSSSGPLHLVFFCFSFLGWSRAEWRRDATFRTQAFERQRRSSS